MSDDRKNPIYVMPRGGIVKTEKGGDFTGRCCKCGSTDLWHDQTAYGCNNCGMMRCTG